MASRRKLEVIIAGDASRLQSTLRDVDGFGKKLQSKFKGFDLGKTLLGGAAVAGIGTQLSGALAEAREAEKVGRVTEQLVAQTGGAANLTAAQVAGLSETISERIGVDDELIQSNANVLLSFKQVADQQGKGNDVFTQAIGLAQDMSQVMGTDAKSATLQLGKALNDPTKGMSALTRAGVMFTDQQRAQVKALQSSGDLLGAQKVILAEVAGEFGGAAEAAADPMDKFKVALDNVKEKVGTALLPVLEKMSVWFVEKALPAMERLVGWVQQNWPKVSQAITDAVRKVMDYVQPVLETLQALWRRFGDRILGFVRSTFENMKTVVQGALNVIRGVIDIVTGIITGKWGRVWDGIKRVVTGAWDIIKGAVGQALNALGLIISAGLDAVRSLIGTVWDGIISFLGGVWDTIQETAVGAWNGLKRLIGDVLGGIKDRIFDVWRGIIDWFRDLPGKIRDAAGGMFNFVGDAIKGVGNTVLGGMERIINGMIDLINKALAGIDTAAGPWVNFGEIPHVDLPELAKGGTATRAGLALVGEQGPEILAMPRGASVIPLDRTSSSGDVHLHFPNALIVDQNAARWLAETIRRDARNGGPVAQVLRAI